ncbi:MAG: DUF4186 domain-containing protein [Lachnospiraceae bacterium]|nr:DUF4186 domain-containing protein [Lachnospiraceae bacterium]
MPTISEALERLSRSKFRSSFHLSRKDRAYLEEKGPDVIRRHAEDFVRQKLAPADPVNDGRQTPMSGHPVFKAMHATACCCRGCMEKWYHVPQHRELTAEEQSAVVKILTAWIEKQKDAQKQVRSGD